MKRVMPYIILSTSALLGCEYTEQDRSRFYENCMQEQLKTSQNFLDDIAIDCACQKWSLREDIKPRNKKNRQNQYNDELQKCYSKPTKLNKNQRKTLLANCHKLFFKTYSSTAEILAYTGTPIYDIAMIGAYSPSIYERGSNKKLVECACNRLSLSDNFVIPVGYRQLAEQYEFAAKECEEIYK